LRLSEVQPRHGRRRHPEPKCQVERRWAVPFPHSAHRHRPAAPANRTARPNRTLVENARSRGPVRRTRKEGRKDAWEGGGGETSGEIYAHCTVLCLPCAAAAWLPSVRSLPCRAACLPLGSLDAG
jgi:hypothetical protein